MSKRSPLGVGIVGCGRIAEHYAESLNTKPDRVRIVGVHDVVPERARDFAARHGGTAYDDFDALLAAAGVDIVLNLTVHQAHAEVTTRALAAGRHVHSEKPLAGSREAGLRLLELAAARGLRLSCSPFSFLGDAQQTFLRAYRQSAIGKLLVVYAEANWGPNHLWNPRPIAFHQQGAGPLLDVGVYPLTLLTAALGPVQRVSGFAHIVQPERTIAVGPERGETFTVTTPDHVVAGLEFASGVIGRLTTGFCSVKSKQMNGVEFHGETGSLVIASATEFAAAIEHFDWGIKEWKPVPPIREPYAGVEWGRAVFDLADSLQTGSVQHCTGRHAYHVLDICLGILESAEVGHPVEVTSRFEPPPLMPWAG